KLLERGVPARHVLYLALDVAAMHTQAGLVDALRGFVRLSPARGRRYIFLDEVTYCAEWATALKAAVDLGLLADALVVATGSHALDLARGTERLPGRRGSLESRFNLEMGYYPFSELVRARGGAPVAASSWAPEDLYAAASENTLRSPASGDAFGLFLRAGGLPRPLADASSTGMFTLETAAVHRDAVLGDMLRAGKNEVQLREILRAVVQSSGSPVTWHGLAERMAIGSKNTVADYLDTVQSCYLVQVLPQPVSFGSDVPAPKKARKVLFRDPFLRHVFSAWATGTADARATCTACLSEPRCTGALVESAVAGQLLPRFGQLMHWRNGGEVDIIGVTDRGEQVRFEVKYQGQITSGDRKHLKAAGGGIVVSRSTLSLDAATRVAAIPAPLLLLSVPAA
ncbi:MAG: ATP-binding protein, partial [Deltaproteobacteria bacterium]|nr:ATP-binding protein [Deltaproteobacteria bacterium]